MGGKDSPLHYALPKSWEMQSKQEQELLPNIAYSPKNNSSVRAPDHEQRHSVCSVRSRRLPDRPCNPIPPSATSKLPVQRLEEQQPSLTISDVTVSPVRLYIESIEPRTFNYAILGDTAVGKTSLLLSYTTGKISDTYEPTICDKFSTSVCVQGKRVGMMLCDTSGHDDFAHFRTLCYPHLDAALICFSVVDTVSYENVKSKWCKEIRRQCPGVPIILIGTQVDKREDSIFIKQLKSKGLRTVSRSEGNKLASLIKATSYIECSALRQLNVKKAFDKAIEAALELNSSPKRTLLNAICTIL